MDDLFCADDTAPLLKRKCDHDSDDVAELLHDICLSPRNKKMRQEFGSASYSNKIWNSPCLLSGLDNSYTSDIEFSERLPIEPHFCELDDDIVEPPPKPEETKVNNERALVLYKPVNPPLFPGGPTSGYQILVNADIFSKGNTNSCGLFAGRQSDNWLQSSSNTNSKFKVSDLMEDGEDDILLQSEVNSKNILAVVPWVGKPSTFTPSVEDLSEGVGASMREEEEQGGDDETMEVDNVETGEGQLISTSNVNYKIDEPWQHYGVPLPNYGSPMWSH